MEFKRRKMTNYIERRFRLDDNGSYTETEDSLISSEKKLIILSDEKGMGKTTALKRIYDKIKDANPNCLIEFIELAKYQMDIHSVAKKIINQEIVMFDGLGELWLENRTVIVNLIKELKSKQTWLASCPSMKGIFKFELSEIPYRMEPFTEANQIELVNKFVMDTDSVPSLLDAIRNHHGIDLSLPFNTQIAAEYLSDHQVLPPNLTISDLYEVFLRNLCDEEFDELHQHLAVLIICPEAICREKLTPEEVAMVNRIGIAFIVKAEDGSQVIKFTHPDTAIYYVAKYFLKLLKECDDDFLIDFLITEVLGSSRFPDIKGFLDDLIKPEVLTKKIYQKLSERLLVHLDCQIPYRTINLKWIFEVNLLKMLYEVISLFTVEDKQKFKEKLPGIDLYFSCAKEFLFLERILNENSQNMNYELKDDKLLIFVLALDSVDVVRKYFQCLEEQIGNQDLRKFIVQEIGFMKPTLLFITSENCIEFLLDYLKEKIPEFESFLLTKNSAGELFVSYTKLRKSLCWIKSNMDEDFYKNFLEICYPSLQQVIRDEEDFLFFYNEVKTITKFDKESFVRSAIHWRFDKAVDVILSKELIRDELLEFTLDEGSSGTLIKLLKMFGDNFTMEMIFPITSDELESLISGKIENLREETKRHIQTIGTVGVLLRVVAGKLMKTDEHFDEVDIVEERIMSELLMISKFSVNQLRELGDGLFDTTKDYTKALIKLITDRKSKKYLFEVLNILLTPELSQSFYENSAFSDLCLEILRNKL